MRSFKHLGQHRGTWRDGLDLGSRGFYFLSQHLPLDNVHFPLYRIGVPPCIPTCLIVCMPTKQDVVENHMRNASLNALWIVTQHVQNERKWEESFLSIPDISVPDLFASLIPNSKREVFLWKFVLQIFSHALLLSFFYRLYLKLNFSIRVRIPGHRDKTKQHQQPWFAACGLHSAGLSALT